MQYLIANWKAQKTHPEIQEWMNTFVTLIECNDAITQALESQKLTIIICPSHPFILTVKDLSKNTGLYVGSQDISPKEPGKYTGEVPAQLLNDIVEFAIIGHSERRFHFQESEEIIAQKILHCSGNHIQPILCVRGVQDKVYPPAHIIAYEPVAAIGTGQNEEPQLVVETKKKLDLPSETYFLYGGSVTKDNIKAYIDTGEIDGYLVGTASLDAEHFFQLAQLLSI